jgi:hypothetical protein
VDSTRATALAAIIGVKYFLATAVFLPFDF